MSRDALMFALLCVDKRESQTLQEAMNKAHSMIELTGQIASIDRSKNRDDEPAEEVQNG